MTSAGGSGGPAPDPGPGDPGMDPDPEPDGVEAVPAGLGVPPWVVLVVGLLIVLVALAVARSVGV